MRTLQVNPIEVKSYTEYCKNIRRDIILVGKCSDDNYYLSELIFKPILYTNMIVNKAILKMYCKSVCSEKDSMNICINNDLISVKVFNVGTYKWDITSILECRNGDNLKLRVYTKDKMRCCGLKEFESIDKKKGPVLELTMSDIFKPVNIVEEYLSTNILNYSNWIDCINLNKYYYFIENLGSSGVEIFIEISPDKSIVFQDSGPFLITANSVLYLQPMRESQYVRISYRSVQSSSINLIKLWFQSKD
ncbi:hypothetical protein GC105_15920 [Alkalibaculum sp. M08DMB]|uniref:DUF6385 domain-containing protein n=1 Tax=Alkalibaculum sporogenes TaxID=2655001 RepID=A0A6A7KD33_9FIRM|nr:DUF6385 domain-containing protein [Alkalibaculum sporogenes]MPW27255.1 hypothetical protein [Alkalibaculum sporogenes]